MNAPLLDRRLLLLAGTSLFIAGCASRAQAAALTVYRDPDCGCCGEWLKRMAAAGFHAKVIDTREMAPIRAMLQVPEVLSSCHTSSIGGYAIEGHVPPADILRLLRERPKATGLAVPGMKLGSPGMKVPSGEHEPFEVVLFGPGVRSTYATYA